MRWGATPERIPEQEKNMKPISRFDTLILASLLTVIAFDAEGQTRTRTRTAQDSTSVRVAKGLVLALDQTPRLTGFAGALFGGSEVGKNWSKAEQDQVTTAILRMLDAAQSTSGESLDGMNKLQVVVTVKQWIDVGMGKTFRPEVISVWEGRVKGIGLETARAWARASEKLSLEEGTPSPAKVILFIAFQDGLFTGHTWKRGQPQLAIARLESFPDRTPVSQWAEATGLMSTSAAVALVQLEDLFAANAFQAPIFEAALPGAKKLLADRKAK
jgi:hypothetical protein